MDIINRFKFMFGTPYQFLHEYALYLDEIGKDFEDILEMLDMESVLDFIDQYDGGSYKDE